MSRLTHMQKESMRSWRLLLEPLPASGAWNMAVDEVLLETCSQPGCLPTLRLYAWDPPCLSLGTAQPLTDVDRERLAGRGWQLVRRPTGGRAVLHTDELTYSVIGPAEEAHLSGGVLESYRRLAGALTAALGLLGLTAEMQEPPLVSSVRNENPVCFEVPSSYEITVAGRKLFGSAQARRRAGMLQHGSLPLSGDLTRILEVLVYPTEEARAQAARRLLEHAATVETLLGRVVPWEQAAEAMTAGFANALDLDLQPGRLTDAELDRANQLAQEKFIKI